MQFSAPLLLRALLLQSLLVCPGIAAGNITFRGPLSIPNIPRVVAVHAGDVNGDGKLDLIASSGTGTVTVLLQDPSDRGVWSPSPVKVGSSCFFSRAGDFDHDGFDDLAVADGASTAYFVRSNGDGTFARPKPLIESRGSRWIATGDWNKDGDLDLASSNLNTRTLTVYLGDGAGTFSLAQEPLVDREHTLEDLDYDGDGILDLALGLGTPGIQLQRGLGDGKFEHTVMVQAEVIPCAQYISTGDFNNDGLGDLAPTCSDVGKAFAAVSLGTGEYKQVLETAFGSGTDSSAVGDLDGDENADLALVSAGSGVLGVYRGNGDGTFVEPSVDFGPTGASPVFLIAADLDRDGHMDVVSADKSSSTLTVFYGREGERFLESADAVTGFGFATSAGVDDFDGDGTPDMFFTSATEPRVHVYLAPGGKSPAAPTFSVDLAARYSSLAVEDFNTDGITDLAGVSSSSAMLHVALLDPNGLANGQVAYPCGKLPQETIVGRIDGGAALDIALPCSGTNDVWLFLGAGDGTFTGAPPVPTIEKPRHVALGDLDGDGRADLLVLGTQAAAVHYQDTAGGFGEPVILDEDAAKTYTDGVIADLNNDGAADVAIAERGTQGVLAYSGRGSRELLGPEIIKLGVSPQSLQVGDVDGDGLLDVSTASSSFQGVSIAFRLPGGGYSDPALYRMGAPVTSHRIRDLDRDGIPDLVAFAAERAVIRLGEILGPPGAPRFLRGDADGDGSIAINDPVRVLHWLFIDSPAPGCLDAVDTNDDGLINLTDPVGVLNWLFRAGTPPAPPGPDTCGEDPSEDSLDECVGQC